MASRRALPLPEGQGWEEFSSLERTHELAIRTAHGTIAQMHAHHVATGKPITEEGARLLRLLTSVLVEAQELEIRRFLVRQKVGAHEDPNQNGQ